MNTQAGVIPFTSAAKRHFERAFTFTFTPTATAQLLTTGSNTQIKAYPYLRSLWIHVTASGGTGGNLAADAPWNALTALQVADSNGSAIYGSQIFSGFDGYLAHLCAGKADTNDPLIYPFFNSTAPNFEFAFRINLEFNHRTGAGALPNMSSNAAYGFFATGNTLANIFQTAPTTAPSITVDVWMECWTLPKAQDMLGRNQMQGPALLGTTMYTTKQTYTGLTASGANTIVLTRKGNMYRKLIHVLRNSSGARIATTQFPNPYEFWWDGNRLTSDDPKHIQALFAEENAGILQSSSVANEPTGVLIAPYDFSAPYGDNYGADGEGGWLTTTQAGRYEFVGSNWGNAVSQMDVITMDVAPIALAEQYALDSQTGKLLYPAQPETR